MSSLLGHRDTRTTFEHYYGRDHKRTLAEQAHSIGLARLDALLKEADELQHHLARLREAFSGIPHVHVCEDGTVIVPPLRMRIKGYTMWSPLPDLNRGPPDVCQRRLVHTDYSQVLYQLS